MTAAAHRIQGEQALGTLVVVGSLNMDLAFRVLRAPGAGETVSGETFATIPGGKGANQAVGCARLGARVAMIGRVGADAFGTELIAGLRQDGVDIRHVSQDATLPSGVAMVMVDHTAQNRIVVAAGANAALTPALLDDAAAMITTASLLVLQLEVPLATVMHAADLAHAAGRPVLLNPAPAPSAPLPEALYARIDYLIPNESEAASLTGIDVRDVASAQQAAQILRGRGVRHVLITLGAQGVLIADETGMRHLPALVVQAVDTTAAGDTFIGGFSAGLLEGMSLDAAAALGQRAAALCVSRPGAQSSIPTRAEL